MANQGPVNADELVTFTLDTTAVIKVGSPKGRGVIGSWSFSIYAPAGSNWTSKSITLKGRIKGGSSVNDPPFALGYDKADGTSAAGTAITADILGWVRCDEVDLYLDYTHGGTGPILVQLRPMQG